VKTARALVNIAMTITVFGIYGNQAALLLGLEKTK